MPILTNKTNLCCFLISTGLLSQGYTKKRREKKERKKKKKKKWEHVLSYLSELPLSAECRHRSTAKKLSPSPDENYRPINNL